MGWVASGNQPAPGGSTPSAIYTSASPPPPPLHHPDAFLPPRRPKWPFQWVWGVRGGRRPAEWPRRRSMAQTTTSGHPTPCWPSPVPYIRHQPHPSSPHSTQKRGFGAENGCFGYSVGYDGAWGGRRQVAWSRRHRAGQVTSGDHPTPAAHQRSQVYASKPHWAHLSHPAELSNFCLLFPKI